MYQTMERDNSLRLTQVRYHEACSRTCQDQLDRAGLVARQRKQGDSADGDGRPVRQGADDFRKYGQRFRRAERKVIGPPDQLRNAGDGPVLGGNQVCFRGRLV